jgi:hypothetical protein
MTDVLEALRQGRFYASSGLELSGYHASHSELSVELADTEGLIELVGQNGVVLDTLQGTRASFDLRRTGSPYVRVRAAAADGRRLWTQPTFR